VLAVVQLVHAVVPLVGVIINPVFIAMRKNTLFILVALGAAFFFFKDKIFALLSSATATPPPASVPVAPVATPLK